MKVQQLRIVIFGLSLSSSWGNGHATTYRALIKGLAERGREVLFLERDVPWYASHRDLTEFADCRLQFYPNVAALETWRAAISSADLVMVGSYVPDGIAVGRLVQATAKGVTVFYDIDTPVTVSSLAAGTCAYLSRDTAAGYDLYCSFTGGPTLDRLQREFGVRAARALYCSVDPTHYAPIGGPHRWDLSYLGTYAADRQPVLERLLIEPARRAPTRRFVVAGAQYPRSIDWPSNVELIEHVPPSQHPAFYAKSRFTLNATRTDMVRAGWSPSVRLFEAAACGAAIISDSWPGLESLFRPGIDIAVASTTDDVLDVIERWPASRVRMMAASARARVLAEHTAAQRAIQLERYLAEIKLAKARAQMRSTDAVALSRVEGRNLL